VCSETLSVRFDRHLRCSQALQAGIEAMGLNLYVKPAARLNSVVGITLPQEIEGKALLNTMSKRFKVEISGSFGPNIVRIGQMGEQCRAHNLFRTLHAFGASFNILGLKLDLPAGMAALEGSLNHFEFSEGM
jgi:aspartate aminotransferase-like enzyme